jgi:hypothetical protein
LSSGCYLTGASLRQERSRLELQEKVLDDLQRDLSNGSFPGGQRHVAVKIGYDLMNQILAAADNIDVPLPEDPETHVYISKIRIGGSSTIEEQYADTIRASLRVHVLSRQEKAWGSMVPIVPENRFTDAVTLLALPGQDLNFRVNVRFYSLNTNIPVQVTVQAFAMNTKFASNPSFEDTLLGTQTITLPKAAAPDWLPHYAQPPDVSPNYFFLSDFTTVTNGAPPPLMRLEIRSTTPGATIWAFATITNNDTQEVTVVSPAEH